MMLDKIKKNIKKKVTSYLFSKLVQTCLKLLDDDVPLPNMRRWTDSLKIKRKKNKPLKDDGTKEEDDDFEEQNEKAVLSNTLMEKTP